MFQLHPREFLNRSCEIAHGLKQKIITPDHLMICLLEYPAVQQYFIDLGIDTNEMATDIVCHLEAIGPSPVDAEFLPSAEFNKVILTAVAKSLGSSRMDDLALVCLRVIMELPADGFVSTMLLSKVGASNSIAKNVFSKADQVPPSQSATDVDREMLLNYCIDLNALAKLGKIDPLIGRDQEVEDVIRVLARRRKSNPVLVGEPGVGKTAIPEGIALRIVEGRVPSSIANSVIYTLDLAAMVAGTRFRGDFEERLKRLIESVEKCPDVILYIDEIHLIMSAGGNGSGSIDAANILKPALARGSIRVIGSTTSEEFRTHIEKDRAILRRFHKIDVHEPSLDETKAILQGIRSRYEQYHNIVITPEAIDAAVNLADRYIQGGAMPDKAIDLIDSAGAHQQVFGSMVGPWTVDIGEIQVEVSRITKTPLSAVSSSEENRLSVLESDLNSVVVGQSAAIAAIVSSVLISRAGLRDVKKPEGSFLFIGPTGVGKTEVARRLATALGRPLLKYDMSEFMERHSVSKLIGAPPGYKGFDDGGMGSGKLINDINDNPTAILLLDEIEKAHEDVFNILLQVMEDAKLTGSNGKSADFRNVILIMTSNVGAGRRSSAVGFGAKNVSNELAAVEKAFSPEFRNRLDAIVPFGHLTSEDMILVVDKFLGELAALAKHKNVDFEIDPDAKAMLAKLGYDELMGARPLSRVISKNIKEPLAKAMLFGALSNGGIATIHWNGIDFDLSSKRLEVAV